MGFRLFVDRNNGGCLWVPRVGKMAGSIVLGCRICSAVAARQSERAI